MKNNNVHANKQQTYCHDREKMARTIHTCVVQDAGIVIRHARKKLKKILRNMISS